MNRKKIFVYDSGKGFSRFLKINFGNESEFICCTNKKRLEGFNLTEVDFAFVIINDFEDVTNLLWILGKVNNIYVASFIKDINDKLKDNDMITLLNLNLKKHEMIAEIRHYIQLQDLVIE